MVLWYTKISAVYWTPRQQWWNVRGGYNEDNSETGESAPEKVLNIDNIELELWTVPTTFCATRYISNLRYLPWKEALELNHFKNAPKIMQILPDTMYRWTSWLSASASFGHPSFTKQGGWRRVYWNYDIFYKINDQLNYIKYLVCTMKIHEVYHCDQSGLQHAVLITVKKRMYLF